MTKKDLVEYLYLNSQAKKSDIAFVLSLMFDKIATTVMDGENVEIQGFGVFYRSEKKPRSIYSSLSKQTVDVPAKQTLQFRASKSTEIQISGD